MKHVLRRAHRSATRYSLVPSPHQREPVTVKLPFYPCWHAHTDGHG